MSEMQLLERVTRVRYHRGIEYRRHLAPDGNITWERRGHLDPIAPDDPLFQELEREYQSMLDAQWISWEQVKKEVRDE